MVNINDNFNALVVGASGAIGSAFVDILNAATGANTIYACSRRNGQYTGRKIVNINIDITDEASVSLAISKIDKPINVVIIATGSLHTSNHKPEKSCKELDVAYFQQQFAVNSIGPAMVLKHLAAKLTPQSPVLIGVLSARVGSINDNKLGGWYAYRASKAALNMLIKNYSIEFARKYPNLVIAGLHPGTVDSELSRPFQANVKAGKLFTPSYSASQMWHVLQNLALTDSGKIFAYDGSQIDY